MKEQIGQALGRVREQATNRERHPVKGLLTVLLSTCAYLLVLLAISAFVNFAMS